MGKSCCSVAACATTCKTGRQWFFEYVQFLGGYWHTILVAIVLIVIVKLWLDVSSYKSMKK